MAAEQAFVAVVDERDHRRVGPGKVDRPAVLAGAAPLVAGLARLRRRTAGAAEAMPPVPVGESPRVSDEGCVRAGHDLHQLAQVHHLAAGRAREQGFGLHVREIDDEMRRTCGAVLALDAEERGFGAGVEQPVEGLAVVDHGAGLGS